MPKSQKVETLPPIQPRGRRVVGWMPRPYSKKLHADVTYDGSVSGPETRSGKAGVALAAIVPERSMRTAHTETYVLIACTLDIAVVAREVHIEVGALVELALPVSLAYGYRTARHLPPERSGSVGSQLFAIRVSPIWSSQMAL
jgi:hypothetical protein